MISTVIDQEYNVKSLKIAMIGHKRFPSREGGVEIVVGELSSRMAKMGHNVHVYNRKGHHVSGSAFDEVLPKHQRIYDGVTIYSVPTIQNRKMNALIYSFLATVKALLHHYDCIHFHAEGPCVMLWLPHLFGIRTVATIHGLDWQRSKWGGFAKIYLKLGEKIAAKYSDELIVLSQNLQNYFMAAYQRKARFIPNGVGKPEYTKVDRINLKWGLQKDEYILYLSRIVPEKGLHYLIDAFHRISTTKKLVIAGGSSHTDEYQKEMKQKALGDPRIIFTDFVYGQELQELYSNSYLYVLPSELEGMPISVLEAMSYSNCCVVSDIPECIEVVEDKAVIFQKGNPLDLKEKLEMLIHNPDIVNRYRLAASDFICNKYNWDSTVLETLGLYRKKGILICERVNP